MKNLLHILILLCATALVSHAQDTIVGWTFPTGTGSDSVPDHMNIFNLPARMSTVGTSAINYTTNGQTSKCAQTTGWDNGNGTKYWQIRFYSVSFSNLSLVSYQRSGSTNPGPRDYKAQYKLSGGSWTDLPGTEIIVANDWVGGAIVNYNLPPDMDNQGSLVYIRWIMTSDTAISDTALVAANGISKIDDIFVISNAITSVPGSEDAELFRVYPNPSSDGNFMVESFSACDELCVFDIRGKLVYCISEPPCSTTIELPTLQKGIYFLRAISGSNVRTIKLVSQ